MANSARSTIRGKREEDNDQNCLPTRRENGCFLRVVSEPRCHLESAQDDTRQDDEDGQLSQTSCKLPLSVLCRELRVVDVIRGCFNISNDVGDVKGDIQLIFVNRGTPFR
jgi:hypothetical protein